MTLKRRRIPSSGNWPHEAAQARESMAEYVQWQNAAAVTGRIPKARPLAQAPGGRRAIFCLKIGTCAKQLVMSPERAPSAAIDHGGLA